jgi:hypothetical protein
MEPSREIGEVVTDGVTESVALYLIRVRRYRSMLFLPPESIEICVAGKRDHVRGLIRKMMLNKFRIVRWFGRVTRVAHRFYQRLEDRIDPLERMIKALNGPYPLRVFHAGRNSAQSEFRDLLRAQMVKHLVWLMIDGGISVVALMFFWVLVPIPGPNIFLYYPALRLVSHYTAMSGARKALGNLEISFVELPRLEQLELSLRAGEPARSVCASAGVDVNGLDAFLERMT